MPDTNTILVAEDDPVQQTMLITLLTKKLGYKAILACNGQEAISRIQSSNLGEINALLLDIKMPVMDGFEALKTIRKYRPDLPVIMLTGSDDINLAVLAIKEGASDFIVKPPQASQLDISIKNAIRLSVLSQELAKMKRDKEGAVAFTDLIGYNAGLAQTVSYGRKAAASDVPVLLMGETGVGKELFARTIHGESKRVGAPFVSVNCSTVAHNIEQILFGTDAPGKFGKIRAAEGGTLFLDDVSKLSPDAQVRMLRLLQQKEIEPQVGGKPIKANVRIIAATDCDIKQDMLTGQFREDLYFRLNVLPIVIPPLREHKEDILPLVKYFVQRIAVSERMPQKSFTTDAIDYLVNHEWPGNVRELESLLHRALVLSDTDLIDKSVLAQMQESHRSGSILDPSLPKPMNINLRRNDGSFKTMYDIEMEVIQTILSHFDNNITRASDVLAIAKSTFYRKIKDSR